MAKATGIQAAVLIPRGLVPGYQGRGIDTTVTTTAQGMSRGGDTTAGGDDARGVGVRRGDGRGDDADDKARWA